MQRVHRVSKRTCNISSGTVNEGMATDEGREKGRMTRRELQTAPACADRVAVNERTDSGSMPAMHHMSGACTEWLSLVHVRTTTLHMFAESMWLPCVDSHKHTTARALLLLLLRRQKQEASPCLCCLHADMREGTSERFVSTGRAHASSRVQCLERAPVLLVSQAILGPHFASVDCPIPACIIHAS